jgi:nucleoside-diphosphate-sugar epimerase
MSVDTDTSIVGRHDLILVTGASGFIGLRVVAGLLTRGFHRIRCLARPGGNLNTLNDLIRRHGAAGEAEVMLGNLLSPGDCARATDHSAVIYHLAAGRADMFADAFMNSAVATRNLVQAGLESGTLKRFVNVSSFSVYTNRDKARRRLLDESCPIEGDPARRGDPYMFGKTKQDEIVLEYGKREGLPYVIVRPGCVYGPGNEGLTNRVGIGTFGIFLHMGGGNTIPLTYVDNCADAIVLAGLTPGVDGEVFNVVDDDLPSSRAFLRRYKKNVKSFRSIYVPHVASYILSCLWEKYSYWSEGQLPPTFNWRSWHAYWKKTSYSNRKLKSRLGWQPLVSPAEAERRYFEACRKAASHA